MTRHGHCDEVILAAARVWPGGLCLAIDLASAAGVKVTLAVESVHRLVELGALVRVPTGPFRWAYRANPDYAPPKKGHTCPTPGRPHRGHYTDHAAAGGGRRVIRQDMRRRWNPR